MATSDLPIGFRFEPKDDELISHYLWRKVWNLPENNAPIFRFDLYGSSEPWCWFKEDSENCLYVYTRLKKKSEKSNKRISRTAGCGTWKGQTKGTDIFDMEGKLIGNKKLFTFEVEDMHGNAYNNIMHEYSLAGVSLVGLENSNTDMVLCRIKRKSNKSMSTTPFLPSEQDDVDLDSIEWII